MVIMLKEIKHVESGQIHLAVNMHLKQDAEVLLKQMGLSMAEAVRLFLKQIFKIKPLEVN